MRYRTYCYDELNDAYLFVKVLKTEMTPQGRYYYVHIRDTIECWVPETDIIHRQIPEEEEV